jgi:hypothetical protein
VGAFRIIGVQAEWQGESAAQGRQQRMKTYSSFKDENILFIQVKQQAGYT